MASIMHYQECMAILTNRADSNKLHNKIQWAEKITER